MLNDKVLVEAVFNDVLPFKWHATSVQGLGPGNKFSFKNLKDNFVQLIEFARN